MIEYSLIEKTCPVCGEKSLQKVLKKNVEPLAYFLDGSPSGESLEALPYIVDVCKSCGFTAYDFSKDTDVSRSFLQSKEYQALINPRIDENISKYARLALISISHKDYSAAVREFLSASWCADMLYDKEIGVLFRKKALEIWTAGGNTEHLPNQMQIRIIDTMRRAGMFDETQKLALLYLENADDTNRFALQFELELSSYGIDTAKTQDNIRYFAAAKTHTGNDREYYTLAGRTYFASVEGYGRGWNWNPGLRILTLLGYHGGGISFSDSITILLESGENLIREEHGASITVNGDLHIVSKSAFMQVLGGADGIFADGCVISDGLRADIRVKNYGISAGGDIVFNGSQVFGKATDTFLKSSRGGLYICDSTLSGVGEKNGAECFSSSKLMASVLKLESPRGTALIVRKGSHSMSICMQTLIGSEFGIRIEEGSIINGSGSNTEVSGNTALYVKNTIDISSGVLSAAGKDCGIFCEGAINYQNGGIEATGDIGLRTLGDFVLENCRCNINGLSRGVEISGRCILTSCRMDISSESGIGITCQSDVKTTDASITAIGSEFGMSTAGDIEKIRGGITASGNTALKVDGNLHNISGMIHADGIHAGADISGNCVIDAGKVTVSGRDGVGIQIRNELKIVSGNVDTIGKEFGLKTGSNCEIITADMTATGKTGVYIGGSMKTNSGVVRFSGDETGLCIGGGSLTTDGPVLIEASGDAGVYVRDDLIFNGGVLHISGQFFGIVISEGNAVLKLGSLDVTGDEYGMLIQKGSMQVFDAVVNVTSESTGICLDAGDAEINASRIFVSGKKYGIEAAKGSVVLNAPLDVFGGECAVISKKVRILEGTLNAKSDKYTGTALIADEITSETDIVAVCGDDEASSKEAKYDHQSYLHLYPQHHFRLTVAADVDNMEIIFKWLEKSLMFCGIPPQISAQMMLVIEEFFVNIARYAYPDSKGNADFILYCGRDLKLVISDTGIAFDPLSLEPPDSKMPIQDRTTGGWGIYLSRKLTDKITYERDGDRNILTIYKKF